jgi:hypothetical protein
MPSLLRLRPRGRVLRGLTAGSGRAPRSRPPAAGTIPSRTLTRPRPPRSPKPTRARLRSTAPSRSPSSCRPPEPWWPPSAPSTGHLRGGRRDARYRPGPQPRHLERSRLHHRAPTLANDNAKVGVSLTGRHATGNYCVRVYDSGKPDRRPRPTSSQSRIYVRAAETLSSEESPRTSFQRRSGTLVSSPAAGCCRAPARVRVERVDQPERHVQHRHEEAQLDDRSRS